MRKEERNTKMVATHEIAVSSAQLDLEYTVINHQTVWKDWIETMRMYFMALNIRVTKQKRAFLLYQGRFELRKLTKRWMIRVVI